MLAFPRTPHYIYPRAHPLLFATSSFWYIHCPNRVARLITDRSGKRLKGVSVYLENTLDGTTSDSLGRFKLTTEEKGVQTLVALATGFETGCQPVQLDSGTAGSLFVIRLKVDANALGKVTITAGATEASNANGTVLKPLDILTTAGANADVIRAIQTLPGTQQQGNQTGLFVREGDASEVAVVVDGLTVQNAFFSAAPGVAAHSRFLPFQFINRDELSCFASRYAVREMPKGVGDALRALEKLEFNRQSHINPMREAFQLLQCRRLSHLF